MLAVSILFSVFAISISSMDLALAIVWGRRAHYKWSGFLIVFLATVLGLVFSHLIVVFADILFSGLFLMIFRLVWEVIFVLDIGFLFVFIPIFINWVVARPMEVREKVMFSLVAAVFVLSSLASLFVDTLPLERIQFLCFLPVVIYTIGLMRNSRKEMEEKSARMAAFTIEIVSLSILPMVAFTLVWPWLSDIFFPLIALSYFIMLLVFLFIAIQKQERGREEEQKEKADTQEESRRKLMELYHITDREMEVIELIKLGLTNKEIASRLNISVNTVNNHISNSFTKTGVRCRIDLLNLLQEASW